MRYFIALALVLGAVVCAENIPVAGALVLAALVTVYVKASRSC